ncbi:hypothetical protein, partial [Amnimonas aquatica]|uniref:hypothetical protein n=1 Tax=Amnimonas aquatica TaxID=2094561 RepID=UPI0019D27519
VREGLEVLPEMATTFRVGWGAVMWFSCLECSCCLRDTPIRAKPVPTGKIILFHMLMIFLKHQPCCWARDVADAVFSGVQLPP